MDMLIDLAGPRKQEPQSAMEKVKEKPSITEPPEAQELIGPGTAGGWGGSANGDLTIEGLVEYLLKKQLSLQVLWATKDLMSTKPRRETDVYS